MRGARANANVSRVNRRAAIDCGSASHCRAPDDCADRTRQRRTDRNVRADRDAHADSDCYTCPRAIYAIDGRRLLCKPRLAA